MAGTRRTYGITGGGKPIPDRETAIIATPSFMAENDLRDLPIRFPDDERAIARAKGERP